MTATQTKEFTLPFVGREEELRFLLNEYDQMLHAQYRSVWIEAPAGMGKTTLVEEFLKRIAVPDGDHLQDGLHLLKPWIVHAHLRERSSNSLASFVEALGAALQTLTEKQREKLFSGLTSFYQERARKIVGGGNVQSMDMEEAITTTGYILKQLSKYFPLVIIIEDIHVLKGEVSFYGLRHLQAIVEHVPMLMMFLSRPSEEKNLKQFHNQIIKEGSKKLEVTGLNEIDVSALIGAGFSRPDGAQIKELMHLSGGNALLLRELLKSNDAEKFKGSGSTTERIIHYLLKDLERLPKNDRQVIAIAGTLGEEFSEQLLHEITESKNFTCWSRDVLERFEQQGIIRRRKKNLKPEGEGKEISLRVSVFAHALWWEAARKLYAKEKLWTDKKIAEAIVPLLSHQDYPLLTDAELLTKLFRWFPNRKSIPLLIYTRHLCGFGAGWEFHSHHERVKILAEAHRCIIAVIASGLPDLGEEINDTLISLLNAEQLLATGNNNMLSVDLENGILIRKLVSKFSNNDLSAFKSEGLNLFSEAEKYFIHYAETEHLEKVSRLLTSLTERGPKKYSDDATRYVRSLHFGIAGLKEWFTSPRKAAKYFYEAAKNFSWEWGMEQNLTAKYLTNISSLPVSQAEMMHAVTLAEKLRKEVSKKHNDNFIVRMACRAEIRLLLRAGLVNEAAAIATGLVELSKSAWRFHDRYSLKSLLLTISAHKADIERGTELVHEIFSDSYGWIDEVNRFKGAVKAISLMEEWDLFERLWVTHKNSIDEFERRSLVQLLEVRVYMCLLLKNNEGRNEALRMLKKISGKYPVMNKQVQETLKKLNVFLRIDTEPIARWKKKIDNFFSTDDTLSEFDRAYYAQLFARIGVRYGHDPIFFSSFVEESLSGFVKLDLPKRVVFTAEKFAEVNLIPQKELQRIRKKYGTKDDESEEKGVIEKDLKKESSQQEVIDKSGIKLTCLGPLRATNPAGKEIVRRKLWGVRETQPSYTKRIVIELVRGKYEHRVVRRKELLEALFPAVKSGLFLEKKMFRLERILSSCLSQLKKAFLPYEIFQKDDEGYSLHPSVRVDLFDAKDDIVKARTVSAIHPPSALWLFSKVERTIDRGEFGKGAQNAGVLNIRKELIRIKNDIYKYQEKSRAEVVL